MLPIAVDVMGGDKGPGEIVAGAREAAERLGVPVVLIGQAEAIPDAGGLEVWPATEVIDMGDDPLQGEPSKGNELVREAHALLAAPGALRTGRFVGNVEGRDVLTDAADVVVTDGFTGNVVLKTLEGSVRVVVDALLTVMTSTDEARAAT